MKLRLIPRLPFLSIERDPPEVRAQPLADTWQPTLAFMQGKSIGGLRAVQVDQAGNLNVRGVDLSRIDDSASVSITSTGWVTVLAAGFHLLTFNGYAMDPTDGYFQVRHASGDPEIFVTPVVGAGYHDGVNVYLWLSGSLWITGKQVKLNSGTGSHKIRCVGYRFSEQ